MSAHRTAWNLFFQVVPILQAEHYQLTEVGGGQGGTRKGDRDRGDRDRGTGTGGTGTGASHRKYQIPSVGLTAL